MSQQIKLLENPETWKGSYDLHAYCKYDNPEHDWREFPHMNMPCETGGEARNQLRSYGWIFHKDGTATCPKCAKALSHPSGGDRHGE